MEQANYKRFLEGERIYLREVRLSDVNERYYNWMNDSEVTQYLEKRYIPQSMENIRNFVIEKDGSTDELFFAICLIENDLHIGNIKLGPINWIHRFGDISLLIGDKTYWGQGFATQAIRLVVTFAFETLNLHKLRAGYYAGNIGSGKAFIKNGFKQEGILKNQWFIQNQWMDEILLGLEKRNGS
jgi:ribosomal-protein-alanine N-acetyltransferase